MKFSEFTEPRITDVTRSMLHSRIFLPALCIVLLPLLLLPLGIRQLRQDLQQETGKRLQQVTEQHRQNAERALRSVETVLVSSTSNARYIEVGRTEKEDDSVAAGYACAELYHATEMNELIQSSYLLCNLNHTIYNSVDSNRYPDSEFYDLGWRQQYYASRGGIQLLDTPRSVGSPSKRGELHISLVSRVPYFSTLQNKVLVFNVGMAELMEVIVSSGHAADPENRGYLWLYNGKGELLWDENTHTAPDSFAEFAQLTGDSGWQRATVNNNEWMIVSLADEELGWRFVEVLPWSVVESRCREQTNLIIGLVGLAVLAMAAALFLIAHHQQKRLLMTGQAVYRITGSDMVEDEEALEFLQRLCTEKHEAQQRDSEILSTFAGVLEENVVLSLISGDPVQKSDVSAYRQMMRNVGLLDDEEQKYAVFVIRVEAISALKMNLHQDIYGKFRRILQYSCNEQLLEEYKACYAWADHSTMVGVLHCPARLSDKQLREAMDQMGHSIQKQLTLLSEQPVVVAFGDVAESPWHLTESHEHARELMQHKIYYRKERPYTYLDVVETDVKMSYDRQKQLVDQVKLGKVEEAAELLENYFTILHSNPYVGLERVREICVELARVIQSAIGEKEKQLEPQFSGLQQVEQTLNRRETVHEVADCLVEYARAAAGVMLEQLQKKKDIRVQDVLEWIENNYNRDISLDDIARQMDLSPTYASKQIKAYTGQSVVNYINQVRIEHAKELLATTKMSSNEIGTYVGFRYSQSFIRTFRKSVGMTPGNYRSLYQKDGGAASMEEKE